MSSTSKAIVRGLCSYLPGFERAWSRGTGGSTSARYCYSAWLRHLVKAGEGGLPTQFRVVAELGPGDSLGIGMAALLTGSEQTVALDVARHSTVRRNLEIFDQLVELLQRRAAIPDEHEFPQLRPRLADYAFPDALLDQRRLAAALSPERVARLRASVAAPEVADAGASLRYEPGWTSCRDLAAASVDLLVSQAVLEHVEHLEATYRAMARWVKAGGVVSHQIDFKSHGTAERWNGHWAHSDLVWRLVRGRRAYLLNREPCSRHLSLLAEVGFRVTQVQRAEPPDDGRSPLRRGDLAPRFQELSELDLCTSGVFVQAVREGQE